mgnify:CR=1 FL=1
MLYSGGGITERNVQRVLEGSGATEFHCSARSSVCSLMEYCNNRVFMGAALKSDEFLNKVTDTSKVQKMVKVSKFLGDSTSARTL